MEPTAVPIKTEPQDDIPFTEGPPYPFIHVKKERENKAVQTEAPPLGIIRDRNSRQRNEKVQVKLPASEKSWKRDPKTKTLHHKMKQARQEADQLREQMVPREKYEELQQEAEQLREQEIPREKYEELQQQLRNMRQSESQAFEGWQKEQEKVAKVTRRLDAVIKQLDTVCSLYSDVLTCRALVKNYALFLLERYLRLKIKAVRAGAPIQINTVNDFIDCCKHYGVKVQRLLCEFYLHNMVLEQETDLNPGPFVGDIQLQAFVSFGVNQLKWLRAYNAFQRQENSLDLWVRAEPRNPVQLWKSHKILMRTPGVIELLGPMHKDLIRNSLEYFLAIKDFALDAAKFRYQISPPNIQLREPFKYENFELAAERLSLYGQHILRAGPSWLGYWFRSPIIWHPAPGYQALYNMPTDQSNQFFDNLISHHGCRPPHEVPSPAYSLTALHVNYNVFMRP